jgi:hypothetical protein
VTDDAADVAVAAPPSRAVRRFVAVLFALLAVAGLIGFEAWPLTAWRLFSLARTDRQTRWEIDAVREDGTVVTVDLDELPIAFRNAEWPLSALPGAGEDRRDRVCEALLDGVRDERPDVVGLRVVRNHRRLDEVDGGWEVSEEREPFHACGDAAEGGG